MKLEAKLDSGRISFDVWDLLSQATGEERAALINALACQREVVDEVANQLIDGWTSDGSHGPTGGASIKPYGGIDLAVRRVAEASGGIAAKEIERLKDALTRAEARINEGWNAYHQLIERRGF
jgi:hypothetical protein